jgi:thioredoxin-related protein
LKVIRVNIQDPKGRALAEQYDFQYTPTFIYFDGSGKEVWRTVGKLDVKKIRETLP